MPSIGTVEGGKNPKIALNTHHLCSSRRSKKANGGAARSCDTCAKDASSAFVDHVKAKDPHSHPSPHRTKSRTKGYRHYDNITLTNHPPIDWPINDISSVIASDQWTCDRYPVTSGGSGSTR